MKKLILFLSFLFVLLYTCKNSESEIQSKEAEKKNALIANLGKRITLKFGPVSYDKNSNLHIVYGASGNNVEKNYITELHFKFGGKIDCNSPAITASFDFSNASEILNNDSINKLLPITKELIHRKRYGSNVIFELKNENNHQIPAFAVEKVNLKPNGRLYEVDFTLESKCLGRVRLPIIISKHNTKDTDDLILKYISNELNLFHEDELEKVKVIFSFNPLQNSRDYLIDLVDQRKMQILSYDAETKDYIISDYNNIELRRIKRST